MEIFRFYKETVHPRWGHRVYEVSNMGRIKLNGEIVKPKKHGNYLILGTIVIHRAVAELFVPNLENKPCVDHINTITTDNRADNLRWVTYKENSNNTLTKEKQSNTRKGIPLSEEHKAALKGVKRSEQARQNISNAAKGRVVSDKTREKLRLSSLGERNGMYGVKLSDERKSKISNAKKGTHKVWNEDHTKYRYVKRY